MQSSGSSSTPQTYVNIGYVLLALPLGTAYFVFLATGMSVGLGTIVIWVGIPILLLVLAVSWAMAAINPMLTSHTVSRWPGERANERYGNHRQPQAC